MKHNKNINYHNSKKAILDIPTFFLVKMIIGLFGLVAIIPIIMMFNDPNYNRTVANDLSESIYEFVEYSNSRFNSNMNQCYHPFNLQYLSNPQVYNNEYKNYVVILTQSRVGLIEFEDYMKVLNNEADFNSFGDVSFDDIRFDEPINLDILNLDDNSPNLDSDNIEIIFFVPSIAYESVLLQGAFKGDSKSGYHVLYGVNEASEFTIKPNPNIFKKTYNLIMGDSEKKDSSISMYDFGFFKFQGNSFGPVINQYDSINSMGNCRSSSSGFDTTPDGSNPNHNTKGFMCTVELSSEEKDVKEVIRNNIYWEGREGYKCGSELQNSIFGTSEEFTINNKNFCSEFKSQYSSIFDSNRNQDLEEVKTSFEEFCNSFYPTLLVQDNNVGVNSIINSVLEEGNDFVYKTEFDFSTFFTKIPDGEIIRYAENAQDSIFRRDQTPNNCREEFEDFGDSNENLCNFVVKYEKDGVTNYAFYIDLQNEKESRFYTVKNEDFFELRRDENDEYFAIGNRRLDDTSSSLRELKCGFWDRTKEIFSFAGIEGCSRNTFNVLTIEQNYFTDVSNPRFQVYVSRQRKANKQSGDPLQQEFSTYFKQVSDTYKSGENNEAIEINGREYILDTTFIDTTLKGFNGIQQDSNGFVSINSVFKFENFEKDVAYDISKNIPNTMNSFLTHTFENNNNNDITVDFTISFEQALHSIYNHQSLEKNKILNEIENENFLLIPAADLRSSSISLYYVVTKNSKKPVFEVIENEGENKYIPLTFNMRMYQRQEDSFKKQEFNGNIIYPKYQQNGDFIFERIPYKISGEEVISIIEESGVGN